MKCLYCGIEFPTKTKHKRKYCSRKCQLDHYNKMRLKKEPSEKICVNCGKGFKPAKNTASRQICCSLKCSGIYYRKNNLRNCDQERQSEKKRRELLTDSMVKKTIYIQGKGNIKYNQITPEAIVIKREQIQTNRERKLYLKDHPPIAKSITRVCVVCGVKFENVMPNAKYCSVKCSMSIHLAKVRHKWWQGRELPEVFNCKECGALVTPLYEDGTSRKKEYCSIKCANKYMKRIYGNSHNHRARHFGCEREAVNPIKVFIRDGWKCQLCKKQLRKENRGTLKDTAPELDHIIPLSKGGSHTYMNTQCACRRCNSDKGAEERGQLRLFG